jgi:transcriptional regulator with XRE-family HTH domain
MLSIEFPDLLAQLASERGLSLRALAMRAGMDPSYLNRVRHRERPLPIDRVEHLANALGLGGDERQSFIEQAHLTIVPEFVRSMIIALREELHLCREQKTALEQRILRRAKAKP